MIDSTRAYEIAQDAFRENDYIGIKEMRKASNGWMAKGQTGSAMYGGFDLLIQPDGTLMVVDLENTSLKEEWDKGAIVTVDKMR